MNKYHAEHRDDKKRGLTGFDTMKMLTSLKKDTTWLNEINSQSLQHSLVRLDMAFKSSFRHNNRLPEFQVEER